MAERYRACIDIGGTFTDCLIEDPSGKHHIFKAATTPPAFQKGFIDVLARAAEHFGVTLSAFLGSVAQIVHGSTVSTNALVEMKVARTGFLCNEGHLDILTIREAVRKPVFSWQLDYPDPFVPRGATFGIPGRIDAQGNEIRPLDEEAVRRAATAMKTAGVEAVGISFLWSIVNPAHELRAREIVQEVWPSAPVTLGHEINPIGREYRRSIATVIDASLHPIVSRYVTDLVDTLEAEGYEGELLLANCVGGMMPPAELVRRPIYSVMSGPTLAPIAAQHLAPERSVIVADMGGTTFDVSIIRDGQLVVSQEAMIGNDMLGISKIDVRSVGAGGGSIAWIDPGGMLHVGPRSASAQPGPACYGRGGTLATVTDANVVLGILDPDNFLGGQMKLDAKAAETSLKPLAEALKLSVVDTAYAIYTTSNNVMVGLIEDMTVKEGVNPRDSSLVVGGGATASHIGEIASELGIRQVLIPRFAAGLSAFGGLISDIRWERQATVITGDDAFAPERVNAALEMLHAEGEAFLHRTGINQELHAFEYVFLGRYRYQSWEIEVPFTPVDGKVHAGMEQQLAAAFHEMHERIYSVSMPDDVVEFTTWKLRAIGRRPERIVPAGLDDSVATQEAQTGTRRQVYFREKGGMIDCPVYQGSAIAAASWLAGPAVIEEPTTTIYVPANARVIVDPSGNYLMTLS